MMERLAARGSMLCLIAYVLHRAGTHLIEKGIILLNELSLPQLLALCLVAYLFYTRVLSPGSAGPKWWPEADDGNKTLRAPTTPTGPTMVDPRSTPYFRFATKSTALMAAVPLGREAIEQFGNAIGSFEAANAGNIQSACETVILVRVHRPSGML